MGVHSKMSLKLKDNLKNIIKMFKSMSSEEVQVYKYLLMVLLIFDLVGLYWYLNLKALGIACMLVIMGFIAVFLLLEKQMKGGGNKMTEEKQTAQQIIDEIKKLDKEKELKSLNDKRDKLRKELGKEEYVDLTPKEDKETGLGLDMGLPDADTYQERANKALGADQF